MLESIAFIPDGNRRYASENGLSLAEAYSLGFDRARKVTDWCFEKPEIKEVTIWSISTENLKRNPLEVRSFMDLLKEKLDFFLDDPEIHKNEIKVRVVGKLEMLPHKVRGSAKKLMDATSGYSKKTVNMCMGYGGRAELVDAITKLVAQGGKVTEDRVSSALYLDTTPDMIVRTGGTKRLSGFMPWQSAYSELYFSKKLWPEFQKRDLSDAITDFHSRERRFGL